MSDADRRAAAAVQSAGPSTLSGLQAAIKARMEDVAAAYWGLPTKTSTRAPTVVDGWLPPKSSSAVENFPFLIVRPRRGTDSPQEAAQDSTATFDIIVGTYRDADDGFLDVLVLIEAIRQNLGAAPAVDAFEQIGPLTWELPEEQTRPEWFGRVTTIWQLPRPRRVEASNPTED